MDASAIRRVAELLLGSRYTVALTGAGISTPSGIPDFRSPGSGLWEKANPMLVASIWAFRLRPQAFFDWFRPLGEVLLNARPNPAHIALAKLEAMGLLAAVITQNIDDLHQKAGSTRVLELHGHLRTATCQKCHKRVSTEGLWEKYLREGVPRCACGGVLKPDVVLFGEELPKGVLLEAWGEAQRCDLMLVIGSSLEVAPASHLPSVAMQSGAKIVVVNYQSTYIDPWAEVVIHEDVAQVLPAVVECVQGLSQERRQEER